MVNFKQKFFDITVLVQQEFDRNLSIYGEKIKCSRGCSKCCSQIFRITKLDGWIIGEHVRSLPETEREALKDKARSYLEHLPLSKGESAKREGVPCPALGSEGECTIYEARPVVCRRFGMPVYDYKNPKKVHACELNFTDGDEITDTMLIPLQTYIGKKWDELKDEYNKTLPLVKGERQNVEGVGTTIAEAIADA